MADRRSTARLEHTEDIIGGNIIRGISLSLRGDCHSARRNHGVNPRRG